MAFGRVALALVDATSVLSERILILSGVKSVFVTFVVLALSGYVGHSSLGVFNSLSGSNDGPRVIVDIVCEPSNDIWAMSTKVLPGRPKSEIRSAVEFGGRFSPCQPKGT